MSAPVNPFDNVMLQSSLQDYPSLYEKRMINDANGKIQYLAISPIPNAATDALVWAVWKMGYDGNGYLNRYQLPDDGVGYKYSFDEIEDYFS